MTMDAKDKSPPVFVPGKHAGDRSAVAPLLSEISHEIKTPLASIRSNNDILTQGCLRLRACILSGTAAGGAGAAAECAEILSILEAAVYANRLAYDRIRDLVAHLEKPEESRTSAHVETDLHEEINRSLAMLGSEFRSHVRITREFGTIPKVLCRPAQIGQVITNILVNAFQAVEDGGEIRIRSSQENDNVRIEFEDNGKGIPPELQEKIFEPGVTSQKSGSGHGLGLHICRRILHDHGGQILVKSEPGKGSTFTILLPVRQSQEGKHQ
jgi:two-component system NtrC family sensor kinase